MSSNYSAVHPSRLTSTNLVLAMGIENFTVIKTLGEGAFASVHKVRPCPSLAETSRAPPAPHQPIPKAIDAACAHAK